MNLTPIDVCLYISMVTPEHELTAAPRGHLEKRHQLFLKLQRNLSIDLLTVLKDPGVSELRCVSDQNNKKETFMQCQINSLALLFLNQKHKKVTE